MALAEPSSAAAKARMRNRESADLRPIDEDDLLQTQVASPTAFVGRPEYFDFAAQKQTPRRSSADSVSPSSPGTHKRAPKVRAATTYGPEKQNNPNIIKTTISSFAKPLRRIFHGRQNASAETVSKDQPVRRQFTQHTNYSASFEDTAVWDRKAILSLDGGGIRGYSALLIIKQLMKAIGQLETAEPSDPAISSYHPLLSTQAMSTDDEGLYHSTAPMGPPTATSPWLPCHYFDYMAGTSTGGLISIMLGRLRMNIDDCIADYEKLGDKVFARGRWFHLRSPLWFPREKYNHRVLEQVIQDVVAERVPKIGGFPGGKIFAFDENRCRVVVVSFQQGSTGKTEKPYLFRTYKNLRRDGDDRQRDIDRNPGPAHDLPIWQVARATSAAPTYFEEVKIEGLKYVDGGFGANNPSVEIFREVRKMNNYHEHCIGILISIGTGMSDKTRFEDAPKTSGRKRAKVRAGLGKFLAYENFARKWAADSEKAHEDMLQSLQPENAFKYYRFNVEQGLGRVKLDEWRQRSRLRVRCGKIIARARPRRNKTVTTHEIEMNGTAKDMIPNGKPIANGGTAAPAAAIQNPSTHPTDSTPTLPPPPPWFQPKNKTLDLIRHQTETYLASPQVSTWIQECARYLVVNRRARAKKDLQRWERACFSAWYQCRISKCPRGEKEYQDEHAMEKHLLDKHRTEGHHRLDEEGRRRLREAVERCKVIVH